MRAGVPKRTPAFYVFVIIVAVINKNLLFNSINACLSERFFLGGVYII